MSKLKNKIAVITGASQGIGLAIAKEFLFEEIEHLFLTGRKQIILDEIHTNVTSIQCDVSNLNHLDNLYDIILKEKSRLDIIVANAGVSLLASLESITEEQYDQTFNINVKGTVFIIEKLLPLLNDGGSILVIGSVSSLKGHPNASLYSASKAALRALTKCWSIELKHRNIRVNTLSPGSIETAMFTSVMNNSFLKNLLETVPMNRLGTTSEVAKTAVFLVSDQSSSINGVELCIDGGRGQI